VLSLLFGVPDTASALLREPYLRKGLGVTLSMKLLFALLAGEDRLGRVSEVEDTQGSIWTWSPLRGFFPTELSADLAVTVQCEDQGTGAAEGEVLG